MIPIGTGFVYIDKTNGIIRTESIDCKYTDCFPIDYESNEMLKKHTNPVFPIGTDNFSTCVALNIKGYALPFYYNGDNIPENGFYLDRIFGRTGVLSLPFDFNPENTIVEKYIACSLLYPFSLNTVDGKRIVYYDKFGVPGFVDLNNPEKETIVSSKVNDFVYLVPYKYKDEILNVLAIGYNLSQKSYEIFVIEIDFSNGTYTTFDIESGVTSNTIIPSIVSESRAFCWIGGLIKVLDLYNYTATTIGSFNVIDNSVSPEFLYGADGFSYAGYLKAISVLDDKYDLFVVDLYPCITDFKNSVPIETVESKIGSFTVISDRYLQFRGGWHATGIHNYFSAQGIGFLSCVEGFYNFQHIDISGFAVGKFIKVKGNRNAFIGSDDYRFYFINDQKSVLTASPDTAISVEYDWEDVNPSELKLPLNFNLTVNAYSITGDKAFAKVALISPNYELINFDGQAFAILDTSSDNTTTVNIEQVFGGEKRITVNFLDRNI